MTLDGTGQRTPGDGAALHLQLDLEDARDVTHILIGLAAMIDPDDPDGLPTSLAQRERDALILTTEQLRELHQAARFRSVERASVARELRRISATIAGQMRSHNVL